MTDLKRRSTEQVGDDHLRCRAAEDLEGDLKRNYAPDVVILCSKKAGEGHEFVREVYGILRDHVPDHYEFPVKHINGPYAFIEWRAREPGRSVEDGADSFVVKDGKIVFQSVHHTLQETMPD